MKRIVDSKVYNTDTADKIASWDNGCTSSDFHHCSEDLYRTKKGSWFLHGEGGAASKYAESCGQNETCGGAAIVPMSADEALDWLSTHGFPDEAEKYFADVVVEA